MSSSTFFLGGSTAFVSASIGNIEISSSNFVLDSKRGKLELSGSITATAGAIGGWTLESGKLGANAVAPSTYRMEINSNNQSLSIKN